MKNKIFLFSVLLAFLAGPVIAAVPMPSGINPSTSAPWAFGDQYRIVFITSTDPGSLHTDIADYNADMQTLAAAAGLGDVNWFVIGSTSVVDARDNTMTNPEDPNHPDCPIFLVDGSTLVAVGNADLWDGEIQHIIDQTENGDTKTGWPHTGTYIDGRCADPSDPNQGASNGRGLDDLNQIAQGQGDSLTDWVWRMWTQRPPSQALPHYAMSEALTFGSLPSYIYPPYGATVPPGDVVFLWDNLEMDPGDPNYTEDIYVEVLFGTDPNKTDGDMAPLVLDPVDGWKVTTVTKEILVDGVYFWQVNSDIGEPNMIEGPPYWFEVKSDYPPASVDIGPDMITWSGQGVDLVADVNDDGTSLLTYDWSYDAPDDVTVDIDTAAGDDIPTVIINKVSSFVPYVANNSFEVPVLADGVSVTEGSVPFWTSAWSPAGSGVWNYHDSRGGAYNPLPSEYDYIPHGENVGWATVDVASDHSVYQVLSLTVQPSTDYELQAKVGNPGDVPTANYRIEIVNDTVGVVLASSSGVSPDGTTDPNWFDISASFTSVADPNEGETLGIRLVAEPKSGDSFRINFDDVQFLVDGQAGADVFDPSKSVVTVNVAVNDAANLEPEDVVTDSMTIDVYETACKAAIDPDGLDRGDGHPTDLNVDCDTDIDDLAIMVLNWLNNKAATGPVAK